VPDVTKNTELARLYCNNNRLTSPDVCGCARLYCDENQPTADALNRIFASLPDRSGLSVGLISIKGIPGTETCNRSIAIAKNREVRYSL
jgi:hypothetical protein